METNKITYIEFQKLISIDQRSLVSKLSIINGISTILPFLEMIFLKELITLSTKILNTLNI